MTGSVKIGEPGSIRHIYYHLKRDENGKYPVVYWGTIEEQVAEATASNLRRYSRQGHVPEQLYSFVHDCGHSNPDDDESPYMGVDDLLDAWKERNLFGLTWRDGPLYYKNEERGKQIIPEYAAYVKAAQEYEDDHTGSVCLASPMGTCCRGCNEDAMDYDDGVEPESCRLPDQAREAWDDFWASNDPEFIEWLNNEHAKQDKEAARNDPF